VFLDEGGPRASREKFFTEKKYRFCKISLLMCRPYGCIPEQDYRRRLCKWQGIARNLNVIGIVYTKLYRFIELVTSHSSRLRSDDDVKGEPFWKTTKSDGPSVETN